jgi:hypothetical protein
MPSSARHAVGRENGCRQIVGLSKLPCERKVGHFGHPLPISFHINGCWRGAARRSSFLELIFFRCSEKGSAPDTMCRLINSSVSLITVGRGLCRHSL